MIRIRGKSYTRFCPFKGIKDVLILANDIIDEFKDPSEKEYNAFE